MNTAKFASTLLKRSTSVINGGGGVQGFSLIILEVEHGLRVRVRGKLSFSFRACEDLVTSAAKYFKLRPRTFTAFNCSLLLEALAQGTVNFQLQMPLDCW
jgi:hypothetical protein